MHSGTPAQTHTQGVKTREKNEASFGRQGKMVLAEQQKQLCDDARELLQRRGGF